MNCLLFTFNLTYFKVYPILYGTLPGYGIQIENESSHHQPSSRGHVSIQVKTLHEVFMSAQRAGYIEAAIRHLCYILQVSSRIVTNTIVSILGLFLSYR